MALHLEDVISYLKEIENMTNISIVHHDMQFNWGNQQFHGIGASIHAQSTH